MPTRGPAGPTGRWEVLFLAGGHDQVGKLVDDQHDVREETGDPWWGSAACYKLIVVFPDVPHFGFLQQVIPRFHFNDQGVEGMHHLGRIRHDGL